MLFTGQEAEYLVSLLDEWYEFRDSETKDQIHLFFLEHGADADILKVLNAFLNQTETKGEFYDFLINGL